MFGFDILLKGNPMSKRISEDPKHHPTGNAVKDPDDWAIGDEAMTGRGANGRLERDDL